MKFLKPWAALLIACALMALSGCTATAGTYYPEPHVVVHTQAPVYQSPSYHPPHPPHPPKTSHAPCGRKNQPLYHLPVAARPNEVLRYALTQLQGQTIEQVQMQFRTNDASRWGYLRHRHLHVDVDLTAAPRLRGTNCVPDKKLLRSLFVLTKHDRLGLMHFDHDLTARDWAHYQSLFLAAEKDLFKKQSCGFNKACFESATYRFSFGNRQAIELVVDSMLTFKMRFIGFAGIRPSAQYDFWKSDFKKPRRMTRNFKACFEPHRHRVAKHHHHTHVRVHNPVLDIHLDLGDIHRPK